MAPNDPRFNRALDVDLPALLADYRALREGELAEQAHLIDPLDHTFEALAPHTTRRLEVAA